MSAPAINALSPAPVRMTPSTVASSRASSNAVRRSAQVGVFKALRTFGRLTVTYAIASFFSYRTLASVGVVSRALSSDAAEGASVAVAGAISCLLSGLGLAGVANRRRRTPYRAFQRSDSRREPRLRRSPAFERPQRSAR